MNSDPDVHLLSLIDRVAARDEAALRQLYDATAAKLYGLALRVVGKPEWAEDCLQDTFLQVWRSAATGAHRPGSGCSSRRSRSPSQSPWSSIWAHWL